MGQGIVLAALLWFASLRVKLKLFLAYRRNSHLKQELAEDRFLIHIRIEEDSFSRGFRFQESKLSYFKPSTKECDLCVLFPSKSIALEAVLAIAKDKSQIFNLIQEQKLKVEGDFSLVQTLLLTKEKIDEA